MPSFKNLLKSKQIKLEFSTQQKTFKKYHKVKYKTILPSSSVIHGGIVFNINAHINLKIKQALSIFKLLKPLLKKASRRSRAEILSKFDTVVTQKPKDVRMGRGKGLPTERVYKAQSGRPLFFIYGMPAHYANFIAKTCSAKLQVSAITNNSKW